MHRTFMRILLVVMALIITGLTAMILYSPYGQNKKFPYKVVQHTVTIKAPVQAVFQYLGHSANAARWSVFVDHIIPLNTGQVPDGAPGSRRRCFKNSNGQGLQWDELIIIVEENKRRQLSIYNMKAFPMQAEGLATEQLYQSVLPNETQITFTLFYLNKNQNLWNELKLYFAAYKVKNIYRSNMDNIKSLTEAHKS